jgi:hypothetical protein
MDTIGDGNRCFVDETNAKVNKITRMRGRRRCRRGGERPAGPVDLDHIHAVSVQIAKGAAP